MTAPDLVTPIITSAQGYAADMINQASAFVESAVGLASGSIIPGLPNRGDIVAPDVSVTLTDFPGPFTGNFAAPTDDITTPVFKDVANIDIPIFPVAPGTLDTSHLFTEAKPSFDISDFTEQPPDVDTTFVMPTVPVTVFPDPPAPISVALPTVVTPTIPVFDQNFHGTVPTLGDVTGAFTSTYETMLPVMKSFIDSGIDSWMVKFAPRYSDQLDRLESKIASSLPGGAAFDDTFEQALYDRMRDRIHAEQEADYMQAAENAAKRGFLLPQGVLTTVLQKIQKASSDRIAVAATEVNIERRKLELQHLQFVMGLTKDLRQIMLANQLGYAQTLVNVNGHALEAAKAIAGLMIETFNALVRLFEAQLDQYKTEAIVFETRLKAALATLEVNKVQVEIARAQVEVNRIEVETYTARIQAEEVKIRTYIAQVDALRVKAELQKLKLEIFSERVKAFIARVQMKEAEFGAYKAAIEGDQAIVQAYATQVETYRVQVEAAKTRVDAQTAINQAIVQYNSVKLQGYTALLEKVKTQMQVELTKFESEAKAYETRLELYKTDAEVQIREKTLLVDNFRANVQQLISRLELDLRLVVSQSELFIKQMEVAASTSINAAHVSAGVAQSAIGALNSVVHIADETSRAG